MEKEDKLKVINLLQKSSETEENMAENFLKKYLIDNKIPQSDVAKAIQRDKVTVNRYVNGTRQMSKDEATKIGAFLKINPEQILFPKKDITVDYILDENQNMIKNTDKKLLVKSILNIDYKHFNVIYINSPGLYCHNEVWITKKLPKNTKMHIRSGCLNLISIKNNKETKSYIGIPYKKPGMFYDIEPISQIYPNATKIITVPVKDILAAAPIMIRYNLDYHSDLWG